MTNSTNRRGDWNREEWAGDEPARQAHDANAPARETAIDEDAMARNPATRDETFDRAGMGERATPEEHWEKDEWVGDQGEGLQPVGDANSLVTGDTSISGRGHTPGEQHWAGGDTATAADQTADTHASDR